MPSQPEKPKPQRFPLVLRVAWRPKTETGAAHSRAQVGETSDVSEGGLCLQLPVCLDRGSLLEVAVRTPEDTVRLSGQVVWSRGGPSAPFAHGMAVTPETPKDRLAWELLLFEQARGSHEPAARLAVAVPLSCQTVVGPLEGMAHNAGPGGVCLLLPRMLAEGEELVLLVPQSSGLLQVNGRVAWVEAEPDAPGLTAHGIAFVNPQAGQAAMEALLKAHRRAAPST
ncbi:MAG: PilZ domain-containing protein [candidate division NC10 bacterium]|nr:PilZ domain-containing protein [candidate division NC10 bacterium]MBI3081147.1 PilZ domain-containing protein [candidate division NC10 bacterium]